MILFTFQWTINIFHLIELSKKAAKVIDFYGESST
jgi:hypothetical protein